MRNAGYADGSWTLLVQNYPSPIPPGSGFRYGESRLHPAEHRRLRLLEPDATWANNTALPTINGAVTGAATDSGVTNLAPSTWRRPSTAAGCARAPSASTRRRV